jgi:hypothetical protein
MRSSSCKGSLALLALVVLCLFPIDIGTARSLSVDHPCMAAAEIMDMADRCRPVQENGKRKFYIIAHNPNTVDDAMDALQKGANALGPDIACHDGEFRVHHKMFLDQFPGPRDPSLKDYCMELATRLSEDPDHRLTLIVWDMKNVDNSDFAFQKLRDIIEENFVDVLAAAHLKEVPMLFTHANDYNYMVQEVGPWLRPKWALGIDELDRPFDMDTVFRKKGFCYSYAHGISFFAGNTLRYMKEIKEAIAMRDAGNSFSFVYSWSVFGRAKMKAYLEAGVDGMVTRRVGRLKALIEGEYADRYDLATSDDNPFIGVADDLVNVAPPPADQSE